jgi:hypothetical protein
MHERLGERRPYDHRLSARNAVCTTPPGVAQQKQAFSKRSCPPGYEIVGNRLTLLDNQGRDAVQLELAP